MAETEMLQPGVDNRDTGQIAPARIAANSALPHVGGNELESILVQALGAVATGMRIVNAHAVDDAQANIDRDTHFIENADAFARPHLRIWRNRQCVVASRSQARSPHFDNAKALSLAAGWPVAVRRSGGTAVVHGPGVLNISHIQGYPAAGKAPSVTDTYRKLLDVLIRALSRLGVRCDYGAVPGACCDGSFNLRWQGRKLAGTAGFITRRNGAALSVFHAAISVHGSAGEALTAIRRFEHALGKTAHYCEQAHVSVAEILSMTRPDSFRNAAKPIPRSST